jgi:hypothetical protein
MGLSSGEAMQSSFALWGTKEEGERMRRLVRNLELRFGYNPLKRVVALEPGSRIPERRAGLVDFEP